MLGLRPQREAVPFFSGDQTLRPQKGQRPSEFCAEGLGCPGKPCLEGCLLKPRVLSGATIVCPLFSKERITLRQISKTISFPLRNAVLEYFFESGGGMELMGLGTWLALLGRVPLACDWPPPPSWHSDASLCEALDG